MNPVMCLIWSKVEGSCVKGAKLSSRLSINDMHLGAYGAKLNPKAAFAKFAGVIYLKLPPQKIPDSSAEESGKTRKYNSTHS